jgi:oligopeptide transport system substrate-binding protein
MTFLDMWTAASGNNDAHWTNAQYDQLISQAKREQDPAKRMQEMHQAEDILMNDMPILPIYYYTNVVMVKPYVKDLHMSPLGFTYFDNATIQK